MWRVLIRKKLEKTLEKLPENVQFLYAALIIDLKNNGPIQTTWKNYSKLSAKEHHCHLGYRYAACWRVLSETEMELEVYYVGSRENAPY